MSYEMRQALRSWLSPAKPHRQQCLYGCIPPSSVVVKLHFGDFDFLLGAGIPTPVVKARPTAREQPAHRPHANVHVN
jgi:hypothetical protein|eukprot:COSAG01_NODE_22163_length_867_cov_2.765930_2_plen_77_part_00